MQQPQTQTSSTMDTTGIGGEPVKPGMTMAQGPTSQREQAQQQATATTETEKKGLDQLLLYFAKFPLEQLTPRNPTGTIRLWKSGSAVTLAHNERISRAFHKLVTEGFLSAPVLDDRGRYMGIMDLLDLVAFTTSLFDEKKLDPNETEWSKFLEKEKAFWDAKVEDVMQRPSMTNPTPFHPVHKNFSVLQAMEIMSRTGARRLPVLDEYSNVVGICTQSMIISLLSQGLERMGSAAQLKVSEMHDQLCKEVYSIREDQRAIEGFRLMIEKNVQGVAIVDKDGCLVDALSARDLRGIGTNASRFKRLYDTVANFKNLVRGDFPAQTPRQPLSVLENEAFSRVISLMDDGNIHRVFEVQPCKTTESDQKASKQQQQTTTMQTGSQAQQDETKKVKAIHVISQIDVIRFVLNKAGVSSSSIPGQASSAEMSGVTTTSRGNGSQSSSQRVEQQQQQQQQKDQPMPQAATGSTSSTSAV